MRIQIVTPMWPGPRDPDFGAFLVPIRDQLVALGHEVSVTAIDARGGSRAKYAGLVRRAIADARRTRPDVVFTHMLFPAGVAGALAARAGGAGHVVMAHGQDVANLGSVVGVTASTRAVLRGADAIICNSNWLAGRLLERIPSVAGRITIADCGIDLDAFSPRDAAVARQRTGWGGEGPAFVCVGSLIERKNVIALADAFAELGGGSLAYVGDGPLRERLEGRERVRVAGRISQADVVDWVAAADVLCQPSLAEPFGQATLEGLAMERSVIATTEGGPPEFVTPEAGLLVDPEDPAALAAALRAAAAMPTPNPAAREAAAAHDVRIQVGRMAGVLEDAGR